MQNIIDSLKTWSFVDDVIINKNQVNGFMHNFDYVKSNETTQILTTESDVTRGEFISEMGETSTEQSITFTEAVLKPKRVLVKYVLSEQLLNDTRVDLPKVLKEKAAYQLQRKAERMITYEGYTGLNGSVETNTNMQLLSNGGNNAISAYTENDNKLEYSLLRQTLNGFLLNGGDHSKAYWLFFNSDTQVLENNEDKVTYEDLPAGAIGKLLGLPIYKASLPIGAYNRRVACVLVDPSSYTVLYGNTYVKEITNDTALALAGKRVIQFEQEMDGKITNKYLRTSIEWAEATGASDSESEEVENPTMTATATAESVVEPETKPKATKQKKTQA